MQFEVKKILTHCTTPSGGREGVAAFCPPVRMVVGFPDAHNQKFTSARVVQRAQVQLWILVVQEQYLYMVQEQIVHKSLRVHSRVAGKVRQTLESRGYSRRGPGSGGRVEERLHRDCTFQASLILRKGSYFEKEANVCPSLRWRGKEDRGPSFALYFGLSVSVSACLSRNLLFKWEKTCF